ncbi:MAG TPA: RES family NAD+ phosphorylase [Trueperaceae bacterium]|nr:RES family NAD+ phosphorylase [Trueperaceae bacterium]
MVVWRIYDHRAAHALRPTFDPLDGQGAALYPGRWNRAGMPLVYTSQTPELAMLELLTKVTPATFGVRMAVEIRLPAAARVEDATPTVLEMLLRGHDDDVRELGSDWLLAGRSLALKVPSAVLPVSFNYLLNPAHPQAKDLKVLRQVQVSLDPRLVPPVGGAAPKT